MKPVNFDYTRPADLSSAINHLSDESLSAKIIAGGQSLGPMLNMRLVQPDLIVDITVIDELRTVEDKPDHMVLGACITHADVEDRRVPDVTRGAMPGVAANIAYRAIRNRGTIGGSLSHADPSADWISILAALGARVTLTGKAGSRTIPVEDYIIGALEADIAFGEVLVSVSIPKLTKSARWGYYKSTRKTGEFAYAIGAFLTDPDIGISRLVVGATGSRPIVVADARPLIGDGRDASAASVFDRSTLEQLVESSGMTDPISRQIHVVAVRRALEGARSE